MPRPDLLALSADDLATLANRGLVKRAQAELLGADIEYTLSENKSGTVSVLWSDDIHCLLPANVALQEAKCSCSATTLCRHLIRSVLAYQQEHAGDLAEAEPVAQAEENNQATTVEATTPTTQLNWNPAKITEDDLAKVVPSAVLARARREWEAGHVIETTGGAKPNAFFHSAGVNVRFLVPHDARYTHCDCAEAPPCVHVPLAVWAFRALEAGTTTGLVSSRPTPLEVPEQLLDELETAVMDLSENGIANTGQPFVDRLVRLERECRKQGLIWPADIIAELREQIDFYRTHNARFDPLQLARLMGELLVRSDAIRSDTGAVPPLFVRGSAKEKTLEVGAARLIGLGTKARVYRGGAELQAFLQDVDSGAIVVIRRDFPNPQADASTQFLQGGQSASNALPEPAALWKLAASPVLKGVGLGALGGGQLLVRGGKRAPSGEFSLGRAPASFNVQSFDWEKLRAPLLAENFAVLDARFQMLPPAALRPRRFGEDIHVVPLAAVEDVFFDRAEQCLKAVLRDREGGAALLSHPFTARGAEGFEVLAEALSKNGGEFRFVAAQFDRHAGQLMASPLALIVGDGQNRHTLQPWIERLGQGQLQSSAVSGDSFAPSPAASNILHEFTNEVMQLIGETLQIGLKRAGTLLTRQWEYCAHRSSALGLALLNQRIEQIVAELTQKNRVRHWQSSTAGVALAEVILDALLMSEML